MFCNICKKESTKHYMYEGDLLCKDCYTIEIMLELGKLKGRLNKTGIGSKQTDKLLKCVINLLDEKSQDINPSRRTQ